tara:strand:- start:213 stop:455 length:243 start_codon:yes stop_codon:yes gene_type:complete
MTCSFLDVPSRQFRQLACGAATRFPFPTSLQDKMLQLQTQVAMHQSRFGNISLSRAGGKVRFASRIQVDNFMIMLLANFS